MVELLQRDRRGAPEPQHPRSHARGVARNETLDAIKALKNRNSHESWFASLFTNHETGEAFDGLGAADRISSPFSEESLLDAIIARDALAALSPAQQAAIEAVAESVSPTNRRYPCIAEGLGITPAAAWARVARARRHVQAAA